MDQGFSALPGPADLLRAVIGWLAESQAGRQGRDAYLALVARNALATVLRDLELGPAAAAESAARLRGLLGMEGDYASLQAALAAALREGRLAPDDPAVLAHLQAETMARLAIDQPKYTPAA